MVGLIGKETTLRDGRVIRATMTVELFPDQDAMHTYDDDTHGNGGY